MISTVRVRYAPSPTGFQHIGGARTALFNYLFAKHHRGTFILRIEDTDQNRSEERYLRDLYESLEWLRIEVDEGPEPGGPYGPYIQSERVDLYREHAEQLLASEQAYCCFCTPERLAQLRTEQEKARSPLLGYDRRCREIPLEEAMRRRKQEPYVIRFKIPLNGETEFEDLLLGSIKRANADINPDPVLLKADGFPTYHLANVIDDHHMAITHIMRAQEWLSSGPLHQLLYGAFGWEPPQFCHLPIVTGQDGAKLSKRHGATSIAEFRKSYLPEALINYIALLGWSFDDKREFFTMSELIELFDEKKLSHSPATFDYQKLEWFNGQYIRKIPIPELRTRLASHWEQMPEVYSPELLSSPKFPEKSALILPLINERLKFLKDAPPIAAYFFRQPELAEPERAVPPKQSPADALSSLELALEILQRLTAENPLPQNLDFESLYAKAREWEAAFRSRAKETGRKLGQLMQPLRYAVTDSLQSPPLIESILILGLETTVKRIRSLQEKLARLPEPEGN